MIPVHQHSQQHILRKIFCSKLLDRIADDLVMRLLCLGGRLELDGAGLLGRDGVTRVLPEESRLEGCLFVASGHKHVQGAVPMLGSELVWFKSNAQRMTPGTAVACALSLPRSSVMQSSISPGAAAARLSKRARIFLLKPRRCDADSPPCRSRYRHSAARSVSSMTCSRPNLLPMLDATRRHLLRNQSAMSSAIEPPYQSEEGMLIE